MASFLPDTSCIVPAVCGWHEHHERAAQEINSRLGAGETMSLAAPALIESYAVLTRLPPPFRLSALDALRVLEESFIDFAGQIASLEPNEYRSLLRSAPDIGVTGGRIYDAVIASCCRATGAEVLLTFNERHFRGLLAGGTTIVVP